MLKILVSLIASFVFLKGLSFIVPQIVIGNIFSVAIFLIVLAIINFTLRPILQFFGIVISFLTLGLFSMVINLFCFAIAVWLTDAVNINASGFFWLLCLVLVSAAVSLANSLANSLLKENIEEA
jgi:putative membrane protein